MRQPVHELERSLKRGRIEKFDLTLSRDGHLKKGSIVCVRDSDYPFEIKEIIEIQSDSFVIRVHGKWQRLSGDEYTEAILKDSICYLF